VHLLYEVLEVMMVITKLNFHSKHAKVIMLIVMSWVLCITTELVMLKGMHDDDDASIIENSRVEKVVEFREEIKVEMGKCGVGRR